MLKVLRAKNFALMEDLTINFEHGLTVVTGETGAGKSMIVGAIGSLCGDRIDEVSIRSNKSYAEITGVFDVLPKMKGRLEESGIQVDDEVIIRRNVERGKRQNSYINDQIVSLNLLKEITQDMIDLVGQYENQSLFNKKNHLLLLDSYTGIDDLKNEYYKNFSEYKNLQHRLRNLLEELHQKDEKIDYFKYQINEIEKADLQPDEEDTLNIEKNLLLTSEKRSSISSEIIRNLYDQEGSVVENLSKTKKFLDELCSLDQTLDKYNDRVEDLISTIDDIYREMTSYLDKIEFSQERLDYVLSRLDTINKIKKKYGKTIQEIAEYLEHIKRELTQIETRDEEIDKLKKSIAETEKKVLQQAETLSAQRLKATTSLKKRILELLAQLGMEKADFEIRLTQKTIEADGKDDVEFFISTNPGEELKPLRRVASGGEISRIVLCLKTILSEVDRIPTVIFDEVDIGIGGRIAEAIGDLLSRVSENHQIICITHLPQITAFADNHILVKKEIKDRETFTKIIKLDDELRKLEIARMLGGKKITKKTIEHAGEMLQKRRVK